MKTGPFAEHSNQLWNISAVPSWSKVNQGLIKMYRAEVGLLVLFFSSSHGLGLVQNPDQNRWALSLWYQTEPKCPTEHLQDLLEGPR